MSPQPKPPKIELSGCKRSSVSKAPKQPLPIQQDWWRQRPPSKISKLSTKNITACSQRSKLTNCNVHSQFIWTATHLLEECWQDRYCCCCVWHGYDPLSTPQLVEWQPHHSTTKPQNAAKHPANYILISSKYHAMFIVIIFKFDH